MIPKISRAYIVFTLIFGIFGGALGLFLSSSNFLLALWFWVPTLITCSITVGIHFILKNQEELLRQTADIKLIVGRTEQKIYKSN